MCKNWPRPYCIRFSNRISQERVKQMFQTQKTEQELGSDEYSVCLGQDLEGGGLMSQYTSSHPKECPEFQRWFECRVGLGTVDMTIRKLFSRKIWKAGEVYMKKGAWLINGDVQC